MLHQSNIKNQQKKCITKKTLLKLCKNFTQTWTQPKNLLTLIKMTYYDRGKKSYLSVQEKLILR